MKWVAVLLIMCGMFYAATKLMPSATAIDTVWMSRQVRVGMSMQEVRDAIGVEAGTKAQGGMGRDETWYYTDTYDSRKHLAIQFIDGHVFRSAIEDERAMGVPVN